LGVSSSSTGDKDQMLLIEIAGLQPAGAGYNDQQDEQYQDNTCACVQSSNCRHADSSHLFVLTDQQDDLLQSVRGIGRSLISFG
jgi:hypothetical protein